MEQGVFLLENGSIVHLDITAILDLRYKIPEEEKDEIFERGKKGETQEQIASDYGMTRRRVGQIEIRSNGNISITSIPDLRYKI